MLTGTVAPTAGKKSDVVKLGEKRKRSDNKKAKKEKVRPLRAMI